MIRWFLFLLAIPAWGADCREIWRPIQQNRAAELLIAGCNPDFYDRMGKTPLIVALESGADLAVVKKLLAGGAKPDYPSKYGNPPLIWAIIRGPGAVEILLQAGAKPLMVLDFSGPLLSGFDVTQKFNTQVPSLYLAAWLQQGAAAPLLARGVRIKPDISGKLVNEMTALRPEDLAMLIQAGFSVQARNAAGQTLLHRVVALKRRDLVAVLLKYGASVLDRDFAGLSVLELARKAGDSKMLSCLQSGACL